jgi:thiol-disulfide isomerase/thioredoxin
MVRFLALVAAAALLQASSIRLQSLDGRSVDPFAAPAGVKAVVFLFTSSECPISNRYAPELKRLAAEFAPRGALFRLVYPDPADDAAAIRKHIAAFSFGASTEALRDPGHALVKHVGATITPEAAVYANGRVRYRGRIDDRYVDLGVERPQATRHDLADAIAAVLAGKPVTVPETQPVGCYIADFTR